MSESLAIYCDFDGTIAERDMIGAIMKQFVPTDGQPIVDAVNAGELTVQQGVEKLFGLLPSADYLAIEAFARERTVIRPGFSQFVQLCTARGWALNVVSGGFDFFVKPALAAFADSAQIFCNRVDTSGPFLKVIWAEPCDADCDGGCGLCKPTVVRQTVEPGQRVIVIGDGVTDTKAAKLADLVFARDKLLTVCARNHLPHHPFDTFYDIVEVLEQTEPGGN